MLSDKQRQILAFPYTKYDSLIADGAIRSGKTTMMTVSFIDWAMREFNGQRFGICGKTVDSAVKNIIMPYIAMTYAKERYSVKWRRSDKLLIVRRGNVENVFEVFGGKDEASFMLIQGRTLAGVLLDEVALMPRSFVEQACARCSVDGSRLWFNCNPSTPAHWFYTDWICQAKEKNAYHLHFELADNPSLTEKIIKRYEAMYTGVFYRRYIKGEWVAAEGLVYDFGEDNITDESPDAGEWYISVDYGTLNPFSAGLWCLRGDKAVRVDEYYYSGRSTEKQRTDEEYCEDVAKLAGDRNIVQVIVDPSAASFIEALKRKGFRVKRADNEVLDGIRRTATFLRNGNVKINRRCGNAIAEFGLYSWNDKASEDEVIKENDHCLTGDTLVMTEDGEKRIADMVGTAGLVWSFDGREARLMPYHDVRMTRKKARILKITTEDGRIIRCTPDHPILTKRGWIRADEITTDDEIVDIGEENDTV